MITKNSPNTVNEVWGCFKSVYSNISNERPDTLVDLGVQAEVCKGYAEEKPSFYFALHYRVSTVEDGEEYSFYELVYCDFDISEIPETAVLKEESIDVCELDSSQNELFAKIEGWPSFVKLRDMVLPFIVHSDEV